ncbi:MAG: glycosyltransferase family 2 protein [Acidimicrobiales bacterium]
MARPRVLLAILVYQGRDFVPACLHSAVGARVGHRDVDVLVLDDASPDPGFSEELRELCQSLDFGYYRSPRNLGIPRNMNLALARALDGGYDYVFILNSDTVLPMNLVTSMVRVAESHTGIGSVTAWSNNVSLFSLPNADDTGVLERQDTVDWVSSELEREFGSYALDVPTGVGFCLLVPTPVVRAVGLFDPVYGRGYCEEVDWCLRSRARGYRAVLAPGTFVFHEGSGSTVSAGMVAWRETTVADHELIVDLRYPWYRRDVDGFLDLGVLEPLVYRALKAVVGRAATRLGYDVEATWVPGPPPGDRVRVVVEPDGTSGELLVQYAGFDFRVPVGGDEVTAALAGVTPAPPRAVRLHDRGAWADHLAATWSGRVPVEDLYRYPQRV